MKLNWQTKYQLLRPYHWTRRQWWSVRNWLIYRAVDLGLIGEAEPLF
jgi:hypothetical protein